MADELHYEVAQKDGSIKKVELGSIIDLTKDIWRTGKLTIIGLVGLQKIANAESIVEKKFETSIVPSESNKQQHVVNMWLGLKDDTNPDNWVRGSGEASMLNTGKVETAADGSRKYEEFNYIDSKYRYAMADKRAFSRAMLKLVRLYGVYSEVEARDFLKSKPTGATESETQDYDY